MTTPAPDPTVAVLRTLETAIDNINEKNNIHFSYLEKLRNAEARRIDANRSGDMAAVALANERAINQASVLEKQGNDNAQMLAIQLQSMEGKLTDRITSLERAQYLDTGKSSIWSNPIVVAVLAVIFGYLVAKFGK